MTLASPSDRFVAETLQPGLEMLERLLDANQLIKERIALSRRLLHESLAALRTPEGEHHTGGTYDARILGAVARDATEGPPTWVAQMAMLK